MKRRSHQRHQPWPLSRCLSVALILGASIGQCQAESASLDIYASGGHYGASTLRQQVTEGGVNLGWQDAGRWGFNLAAAYTGIDFVAPSADLQQQQYALSGFANQYLDSLQGKLSWRPLVMVLRNNDDFGGSAGTVGGLGLDFSPYSQPLQVSVDVAYSDYDSGVTAAQAQVGASWFLNDHFDALTLSGMHQRIDQGSPRHFDSGELTWQHWFRAPLPLALESAFVSVQGGDRQYAVEAQRLSVYNLADLQQGRVRAGLRWRSGRSSSIGLSLAATRFNNEALNDSYDQYQATLDFATRW